MSPVLLIPEESEEILSFSVHARAQLGGSLGRNCSQNGDGAVENKVYLVFNLCFLIGFQGQRPDLNPALQIETQKLPLQSRFILAKVVWPLGVLKL